MSPPGAGSARADRTTTARRAVLPVLVVLAIFGAAVLAGPGQGGTPLDPRSAGPLGTKALVDTLTELGVAVDVGAGLPDATTARALVLADGYDDDDRDAIEDWVDAGGVLILADARSPLAPETVGSAALGGVGVAPMTANCDLPTLAEVDEVLVGSSAVTMDAPPDAVGCFPRDDGSWLVAEPRGDGAIVTLGSPDLWVNANLATADHAPLAVALLDPGDGSALALLPLRLPGEGDAALTDLIGDNVRLFGVQLLLAGLLVIAWRARRLGRPVEEPQPVAIPGSELVVAIGNLLQEGGSRGRAAELLRAELRATLEQRIGLPRGTDVAVLADTVASRSGASSGEVTRVLVGDAPADEAGLLALARDVERLRAQALRPPTAESTESTETAESTMTRRDL